MTRFKRRLGLCMMVVGTLLAMIWVGFTAVNFSQNDSQLGERTQTTCHDQGNGLWWYVDQHQVNRTVAHPSGSVSVLTCYYKTLDPTNVVWTWDVPARVKQTLQVMIVSIVILLVFCAATCICIRTYHHAQSAEHEQARRAISDQLDELDLDEPRGATLMEGSPEAASEV